MSGAPSEGLCERCRRPEPDIDHDEYVLWRERLRSDGSLAVVCPGCMTREEMEQGARNAEDAGWGTPKEGDS